MWVRLSIYKKLRHPLGDMTVVVNNIRVRLSIVTIEQDNSIRLLHLYFWTRTKNEREYRKGVTMKQEKDRKQKQESS